MELDAPQLRIAADVFARIAAVASERAAMLEQRTQRDQDTAAHFSKLAMLAAKVMAAIETYGETRDRAILRVSLAEGIPAETVAHHWRKWCRSHTAAEVKARKLAVTRLALKGLRNDEIAAVMGLSKRTVERALTGVKWSKTALVA